VSILPSRQSQSEQKANLDQNSVKFVLGADHAGYEMKEKVKDWLKEKNISHRDLGTDSDQSVDYPDFAQRVAQEVAGEKSKRGILICGTGVGMSIAANKIKGVRAAVCYNQEVAEYAIKHNKANIFCFGARQQTWRQANEILDVILDPDVRFEGGRHKRRVDKIGDICNCQQEERDQSNCGCC